MLASEMEAAAIYTVAAALGVSAGSVFSCVWNQERYNEGLDTDDSECHDTDRAIRVAVLAIKRLIEARKNR